MIGSNRDSAWNEPAHGAPFDAASDPVCCEFWTVRDGSILLECSVCVTDAEPPKLAVQANGVRYDAEPTERRRSQAQSEPPIFRQFGYVFRIPLPDPRTALSLRFFAGTAPVENLSTGKFFPISDRYRSAYAKLNDRILIRQKNTLIFEPAGRKRVRYELRFLTELLRRNTREERHAVLGRLLYAVLRPFFRKPIWLISDRLRSAGDNGEALFRYLCEHRPQGVRFCYAISERNPAYAELKKIGPVLKAWSWQHKLTFLLSDLNISSQADDDIVSQFSRYDQPYRDIQSHIRFVFLQHGVTKDDLSGWLNRYNRNIAGFVTTAQAESDSIRQYPYGYPDDVIWQTGFPRFDRLYHNEKRCVTVMPTWRHAWVSYTDKKTGVRELKEGFEQSEFYRFFNALLNDPRLIAAAKETGYTIRFLPHPLLQPHMRLFEQNEEIRFLPPDTPYRDVFAESDLILTDYSSVAFDFAYLRKPVLYAQFDRETFFSGEHMYTRGYFDYVRDGFGEVADDYETTVRLLIEYMRTGCRLKDRYRARIDSFFAYDDSENCRRVSEKLNELQRRIG